MKKILLTICMAACGLFAAAQETEGVTYTDDLVISVDQESTSPTPADVTVVRNDDGTMDLQLKNFTLVMEGADPLPIGNINVPAIPLTQEDGYESFALTDKAVEVTAGEPADAIWFGPDLFADGLNLDISGKINDEKLYCVLDIAFGDQTIHVTFGTDEFDATDTPVVNEGVTYTDDLVISVDQESTSPTPADVTVVRNDDGTMDLQLKNFTLVMEGADPLPIGNINVPAIPLTQEDGYESFALTDKAVEVTAGEPADTIWFGPDLFADGLNLDISGKINDEKLYCVLDIAFGDQTIHVTFGTDEFQGASVAAVAVNANQLVNVYTLSGIQVKSQVRKAEALDGLEKGIYIVGGRKVAKK